MQRKNLLFAILVMLFLAALVLYQLTLPPVLFGAVIEPPKAMPQVTLAGANGPVTLGGETGKVSVIFFGFTHCKDVCPVTLARLSEAVQKLGSSSADVQVIFISVDTPRDSPGVAGAYASKFDPSFLGLSGSKEQVDAAAGEFGVTYELGTPDAAGNYEVEHTTTLFLLDRQGRLVMTWTQDQQPDEMASDLGVLLK